MPPHERPDRRKLDLVVFANQLPLGALVEGQPALGAMRRRMILEGVRVLAQTTRVALVSALGAAGPGVLPPLFPIARRQLRRIARRLLRSLQLQHQLDQLVLAELFQITAIHPILESATAPIRKPPSRAKCQGVGNYMPRDLRQRRVEMFFGFVATERAGSVAKFIDLLSLFVFLWHGVSSPP